MNVWLLISTKFIIWRNMKLFSWRDKIDFFSVLDESIWFCFLFYTNDFHTRLKMFSYICELRVWGLWILISKFQYFNFNWTNNILFQIKLIWSETQNIKFSLISRNYTIVFSKHFFMWHTQNIIWEILKFLFFKWW